MNQMSGGGGQSIQCPNCGQPFSMPVEQIIDVGRDPSAKARLLSGQVNVAHCPKCGFRVALGTPLAYHDPSHELLLTFVPMDLGLNKQDQERAIGSLIKAVMNSIPAEQRRGYLFQPKSVLTMQGLIEAILAADGVTPEMLEAQRAKVRLAETLLQTDVDQLPELVKLHDAQIDLDVLDIITSAAENAIRAGREDMAQHALAVRDAVMRLSTAGQEALKEAEIQEAALQDVIEAVQGLGDNPTLDQFLDLVIGFADDEDKLQAIVGLQYQAFNYNFFEALSSRIEAASGEARTRLEGLRTRLSELTDLIRQQQEALAQAAVKTLEDILRNDDVEQAVARNLGRINETFLMVLAANIQAAEQRQDLMMSARLKKIREIVMGFVQQSAPPELQFVSSLLQASPDEARQMIDAQATGFGSGLLEFMDVLLDDLEARGDQKLIGRLSELRTYTAQVLGQPAS